MNPSNTQKLHSWKVDVSDAIGIQKTLREGLILKNTFSEFKTIGGGDVGYSTERELLVGAVAVLSFPELEPIEISTACGRVPFPYITGLLSFREGPILIEAMKKLKAKPDVMIWEGQGIAHPRGMGLASHLGLWLDLPSIGCTKTPLLRSPTSPAKIRGSAEWIEKDGEKVGAVLRTREGVKPVFVSPGHRIDLVTSIRIILAACRRFRMPEPLRLAHQGAHELSLLPST